MQRSYYYESKKKNWIEVNRVHLEHLFSCISGNGIYGYKTKAKKTIKNEANAKNKKPIQNTGSCRQWGMHTSSFIFILQFELHSHSHRPCNFAFAYIFSAAAAVLILSYVRSSNRKSGHHRVVSIVFRFILNWRTFLWN